MKKYDDDKIMKGFKDLLNVGPTSGWNYWKRNEYIEGKKFFDGIEHYDPETLEILNDRGLKPIVINRTAPLIRNISNNIGKAVGEPKYYPTDDIDDENDQYTSSTNELGKWGRSQGLYDHVTASARQDSAICGVGVIESRLNMEGDNVFGEPQYLRVAPIEVIWDPDATASNFTDAKRLLRAKIYRKEEFNERFGDELKNKFGVEEISDGVDSMFTMLQANSDSEDLNVDALFDISANDSRLSEDHITVFDYQWKTLETVHIVKNPTLSKAFTLIVNDDLIAELSEFTDDYKIGKNDGTWQLRDEAFNRLKNIMGDFPFESVERKKYYAHRAFIAGGFVLDAMESPFETEFTYEFYVMFYDENKRCPYGYMRMVKDSQRVSNSAFLHLFHSLLSAPKASIMIEDGASDDMAGLQSRIANRDAVIRLNPGGINKVQQLQQTVIPTGFDQPLQIGITGAFQATGHNLEIAGQQDAQVSGILDKQRTERGYDNLADVIDSYRLFVKRIAQKDLYLFREMANNSPGEVIRVLGRSGIQSIELMRDKSNINFAAIVGEAPPSFNQKQENTKVLMELKERGYIPPELDIFVLQAIIDNADMPNELRNQINTFIDSKINPDPQEMLAREQAALQAQARQQALENELIRANTVEKEAEAAKDYADVAKKQAETEKIQADTFKTTMEAFSAK